MAGSFLDDLIRSQAQTAGEISGITKTDVVAKIMKQTENVIQTLDATDADSKSGDEPLCPKDENGQIINDFGTCRECGKKLENPTQDGFCNGICQQKYNLKHIGQSISGLQDKDENLQGKLSTIATSMNSYMSSLSKMQNLLQEVESLDPKYANYFKLRIKTIIQYLNVKILSATISKNKKLLNNLQKTKSGIDNAGSKLNANLDKALAAIQQAKDIIDQFLVIFDKLYQAIAMVLPTRLEPESIHFNITPKSVMLIGPKIVDALPNNNVNDSISDVLMTDKINNIIDKIFKPLKESDYVLPPAAFKAKKILSSENSKAIVKLAQTLSMFLKGPTEPLPEYKNLKFTNFQFLLFLLTSWGPKGIQHYAMPLYP